MAMERFDYAWFKTRDRAENAIEHYYATGEIDQTDRPQIERRKTSAGFRYVVSLVGYDRPNCKF